jgi:hypothetical protein
MNLIKTLFLIAFINMSIFANAQWTMCNNPAGALPFSLEIHNDSIYMGTLANGVYRSTDGGSNWTQINNGITSMQIWSINQVGNLLFATSTAGKVFKSADGGNNWTLSNTGISSTAIVKKIVLFNGKIYATTSNTGIIISSDNGNTWTQHNTGISGLVSDAILVVDNDLYAGVSQLVFKYDIANQSWISKSSGLPNQTVGSLTYIKDNMQNITLFEGNGNSNDVAKSVNGGDNWSIAKNGLPNVGVYSLLGINTTVFAGNDYGVYMTTDQGANWTDISGFSLASQAKFLTKGSTDLYVLQGGKLWKRSLAGLGLTAIAEADKNHDINIFPNPAKDIISVNTTFKISNYEVADISGRIVLSGKLNNESIDISSLRNGLYSIILITSDNKKMYGKIVKE